MGDRGSIQVVNEDGKSVVLFLHWGGDEHSMKELVKTAFAYVTIGYREAGVGGKTVATECYPEELIALLTMVACRLYRYSAYLGRDENDGDNSDFGHYVLETNPAHSTDIHWKLYNNRGTVIWEEKYKEEVKKDGNTCSNS